MGNGLITGAASALQNAILQAMDAAQRFGAAVVNLAFEHPLPFLLGLAAFIVWALARMTR